MHLPQVIFTVARLDELSLKIGCCGVEGGELELRSFTALLGPCLNKDGCASERLASVREIDGEADAAVVGAAARARRHCRKKRTGTLQCSVSEGAASDPAAGARIQGGVKHGTSPFPYDVQFVCTHVIR